MNAQYRRPTCYLGCDPGSSGGLAVIRVGPLPPGHSESGGDLVTAAMPADDRSLLTLVRDLIGVRRCVCVVERVGGYVKSYDGDVTDAGRSRQPGHTMFKFGVSYGRLTMAIVAAGASPIEVSPVTWQREFVVRGGTYGRDRKRSLRDVARSLYSSSKISLAVSDAVLLAEFARRLDRDELTAKETPAVRAMRDELP